MGGGVIESGPIPYHLLATPLVIINERPLSSQRPCPLGSILFLAGTIGVLNDINFYSSIHHPARNIVLTVVLHVFIDFPPKH